ncbi:MAG: hypothetical protein LBG24_09500 [Treponema sp.]|nr:hypothetical protein [Treponema sp.]
MTVTDIATPWTDERALKHKVHRWVRQAMDEAAASFPVPLKASTATTAVSSSTPP